MTKGELTNIIHKIQNRCALEDPIAVHYYWNDDGKAVFKAFFESLYLPESLRVDDEIVQNTFINQNVYEYEDDFKLIELNQDYGYVAFIPDDQNFKVIKSHKEAIQKEDKKEESLVHLCSGKLLSESFARRKGYILQEGEDVKNLTKGDDKHISTGETDSLEQKTEKKRDPVPMHVAFVTFRNPLAREGLIDEAITSLTKFLGGPAKTKKLFLGVTPEPSVDVLNGFWLNCGEAIALKLEKQGWEKCNFLCSNKNEKIEKMLADAKIKELTLFSPEDVSREAIARYNLPGLLTADKIVEAKDPINDDTSLENVISIGQEICKGFRDIIKKEGGIRRDPSRKSSGIKESEEKKDKPAIVGNSKDKNKKEFGNGGQTDAEFWQRLREDYNKKANENKRIKIAETFLKDLYTKTAANDDKQWFEQRQSELAAARKKLQNGEVFNIRELQKLGLTGTFKTLAGSALSSVANQLAGERDSDASSSGGMFASQKTQYGANASIKDKKGNTKPDEKDKSAKILDYNNDFVLWCAYMSDTTKLEDFFNKVRKNKETFDLSKKFEQLVAEFDEELAKKLSTTVEPDLQQPKEETEKNPDDTDANDTVESDDTDGTDAEDQASGEGEEE